MGKPREVAGDEIPFGPEGESKEKKRKDKHHPYNVGVGTAIFTGPVGAEGTMVAGGAKGRLKIGPLSPAQVTETGISFYGEVLQSSDPAHPLDDKVWVAKKPGQKGWIRADDPNMANIINEPW